MINSNLKIYHVISTETTAQPVALQQILVVEAEEDVDEVDVAVAVEVPVGVAVEVPVGVAVEVPVGVAVEVALGMAAEVSVEGQQEVFMLVVDVPQIM